MKKIILKVISLSLAMMMITASAISAFAVECYTGTFVISGGDASITVYDTQDYTSGYTATMQCSSPMAEHMWSSVREQAVWV